MSILESRSESALPDVGCPGPTSGARRGPCDARSWRLLRGSGKRDRGFRPPEGGATLSRRAPPVGARRGDEMAKAIWNGAVLAESDRCEVVEGNCYFPP